MKTIDYCGTATVRSTSPGAAMALVIGLLVLCFAAGSAAMPDTTAPEQLAQPAPAPAPQIVASPTPWWGPWVFALLAVAVLALVALVIARLNSGAQVRAAELGYGRRGLAAQPRPAELGPGEPTTPLRVPSQATVDRVRR